MASVLLVVASTSTLTDFDTGMRDRLSDVLGHTVTVRQNSQAVDTSGFDLLAVSRSSGSGFPDGYTTEDVAVVSLNHFTFVKFGWGTGSVAVGSFETDLRIIGDAHPIHGGVVDTEPVVVLTADIDNWRGLNGPSASAAARWRFGASTTPIVFSVASGATLLDSKTALQRQVGWGFGGPDRFGELNATGLAIFDAAVEWALEEVAVSLATPTNFTFTAGSASLQLDGSWNPVAEAGTYDWQVERDSTGTGSWVAFQEGNTASAAFQLTTGVDWSTTYRGRVRSVPPVA